MRTLWWTLLLVFLLSCTTMVTVRSTGYTSVAAEDGKYYLQFRSSRFETTREEYEDARWHGVVSGVAAATMFCSLFAFIGLESVRYRARRRP
ncbi:MAG: hypothetical protein H6816_07475 [Phycisphaerales bacterium]|nr:hypothetical protein [Myxococcales bacterium]MCB9866458.1 hypothetical protein [Phycisphaerales bacterium]